MAKKILEKGIQDADLFNFFHSIPLVVSKYLEIFPWKVFITYLLSRESPLSCTQFISYTAKRLPLEKLTYAILSET